MSFDSYYTKLTAMRSILEAMGVPRAVMLSRNGDNYQWNLSTGHISMPVCDILGSFGWHYRTFEANIKLFEWLDRVRTSNWIDKPEIDEKEKAEAKVIYNQIL
jgi:hypothetical protein